MMRTAALCALLLRSGRAFRSGPPPTARATAGAVRAARGGYAADRAGDGYADFEDDFDDFDDADDADGSPPRSRSPGAAGASAAPPSTFYSQKALADPAFSLAAAADADPFFPQLCRAAGIARPSRIQSLAWPCLLRGENAVVADQTGSGKTLAYLLPLLQKLHRADSEPRSGGATARKKERTGSPPIVILAPTAELADQIHSVCAALSGALARADAWSFRPFVTTATGAHATNIRDQIRQLRSTPVDVLISTPGRLATILRTKSARLDLGRVTALVLDEVDFLLVDETFGPQLRAVGAAVNGGGGDAAGAPARPDGGPQFVFVTATLPDDVLESIRTEFPAVTQLRGPGLHRVAPSVKQTLVDVSVPSALNRDARACFDLKAREMTQALRGRRCARTLVFCNTVETCRTVENVLRRKDRGGRRTRVWPYHGALSHEARVRNMREFAGGAGPDRADDGTEHVLVCTDRAARGIDFDAAPVDHVLLFDFPKDPAEYVRRVGRTARAGRQGASTVLAYGWQLPVARQIMGLGGGGRKDGKGKKGDGKLESFTMMKSSDGWEQQEEEDEYYVKGGARRRRELSSEGSGDGGTKKKARWKSRPKQGGTLWK